MHIKIRNKIISLYLLFYFPFVVNMACSQTYTELVAQSDSFFSTRDYEKTISTLELALKTAKSNLGAYDTAVASIALRLSLRYSQIANHSKAIEILEQSLNNLTGKLKIIHPLIIKTVVETGINYYEMAKYTESINIFEEYFKKWESAKPSVDLARAYDYRGGCYVALGDYLEAEESFNQAKKVIDNSPEKDPKVLVGILGQLAFINGTLGRNEKVIPILINSLEIAEKAYGPDSPVLAPILGNLGSQYNREERYADAESVLCRALRIREKYLPSDHHRLAYTMVNLGWVYNNTGRFSRKIKKTTILMVSNLGGL